MRALVSSARARGRSANPATPWERTYSTAPWRSRRRISGLDGRATVFHVNVTHVTLTCMIRPGDLARGGPEKGETNDAYWRTTRVSGHLQRARQGTIANSGRKKQGCCPELLRGGPGSGTSRKVRGLPCQRFCRARRGS